MREHRLPPNTKDKHMDKRAGWAYRQNLYTDEGLGLVLQREGLFSPYHMDVATRVLYMRTDVYAAQPGDDEAGVAWDSLYVPQEVMESDILALAAQPIPLPRFLSAQDVATQYAALDALTALSRARLGVDQEA